MSAPRVTRLDGLTRVLRDAGLLEEVRGPEDAAILGVAHDSRRTAPGELFVAWVGTTDDGHDHAAAAAAAGAVALLVERPLEIDLPQVVVTDGRAAAAIAAHWHAGWPADELNLVAVTGTNGKTTTALLVRHILAARGTAAQIGTLGVIGAEGTPYTGEPGLTTPGPVDLARTLRELVDHGVDTVVFEASSHALDQRRFAGVEIAAAVFTNLSQDHLDYHGEMAAYRAAKLRLLDHLAEDGVAVVNAGDPAWADLTGPRTVTFGVGSDTHADLVAEDLRIHLGGSDFTLAWEGERIPLHLPLIGRFNVENAAAAAGVALALGIDVETVVTRLASAPQIPGRLEVVVEESVTVVIDFAHTPDALHHILSTLRPLVEGRLIVLFGAGGDRDTGKRPAMASAVARFADLVVLTSDNPRGEDPERILDDLEGGLGAVQALREVDRRAAIGLAIGEAEAGDLVLLAGKGHERTQTIGTRTLPFDEAAIAREAWAVRGVA
ncbi:MAG: UDP-N-acetylmuramoyl-L-alanyl-D-glutamate--2,6-diaminopimelate ligase [Longimicrobiales bacterium]|nr:UDP-N-acetylmuramoyl-L-alanyl-D-glutamate--2,6-diaminopimelate ligase [Longimicrobiales bacterium]